MEGNREEGLRKGPWKGEEDEVLINHVSKYGPRDWSSIRSKGLLQRTGKSCRLRWVNKLRPNLKNGCKFSLEEERVVIELQAEFGNKWARIATYLPGRTDNDVKNFWSSRQKRLARILHTSQTSSSSSSRKNNTQLLPVSHEVPILEGGVLSSSSEGESSTKILSCSSSCNESSETIKMVSLPDLFAPRLVGFEQDLFQPPEPAEKVDSLPLQAPFAPPALQPQPDLAFSEEILAGLDPYYDVFGNGAEFNLGAPFLEPVDSCGPAGFEDPFFDDFPVDMFDQIEPLPSPSQL